MPGPPIRTDIVDVYVFRLHPRPDGVGSDVEFLQMRRVAGTTLGGTWQPVIGHMLEGERAAQTALRELREETGYAPGAGLVGFWQLEEPNTYFLHEHECIVMSPCFAAQVEPGREPILNNEHDAVRWVPRDRADRALLWPGQRLAIRQIMRDLLDPSSSLDAILRIDPHEVVGGTGVSPVNRS